MNELSIEVALVIDLFLGIVRFRGKANQVLILDIADNKAGVRIVAAQNLVDADVS